VARESISQRSSYDYVIVGSGAGGPLACNLAKAGLKVLLLEAGGDHEPTNRLLASIVQWIQSLSKRFGNPRRSRFDGWLETSKADPAFVIRDGQLLRVIKAAAKDGLVELLGRPLRFLENVDPFFDRNDWRAQQTDLQGLWIKRRAGVLGSGPSYLLGLRSPENPSRPSAAAPLWLHRGRVHCGR
jgi:choline dehydrogenase-like flavoprotein